MIIINLRSSSLSSYESCPWKYFLEYIMAIKPPGNSSSCYGTTFHKVMELLNKKQLSIQQGIREFAEGDDKIKFDVRDVNPAYAIDWAFEYYKKKHPEFPWTKKVHSDITTWVKYTLDSHYNPEHLDIFKAEHFFEFEIKEPWAYYEYEVGNTLLKGHLKIRGTLDLLIKHNDEYLEYLDYKTGRSMYNWTLGKEKTVDDLKHDNQLLLYYYSLKHEFPQFPHLGMTLFYTKGSGAYPLNFGQTEYLRAEKLLKDYFLKIKNDNQARWIYNDSDKNRQCTYCSFNKTLDTTTNMPICQKYHKEVVQMGLDKVTQKHVDLAKLGHYEGGGTTRISAVDVQNKVIAP